MNRWLWQRWGCLWPSQTSAMALLCVLQCQRRGSSSCRYFHSHAARGAVLGKFCWSSCRMKTIKAQCCSWSSQNIPHGLKAVMCGKATLPASCALEFRGKWESSPSHLTPIAASSSISMRWGLAVVGLSSSFPKFNISPVPPLSPSPQRQNWFSWCCCTFNVPFFMFMFVPTEWPLAQTTWTCITRKLTTLEPPVCHYPS